MNTITPNLDDLLAAFQGNARVAGFTLPYTLARLHGYQLVNHKSGWLLKDADGLWKLRVLTDKLDFDASNAKGVGRAHSAQTWESNTDTLAGFIVVDHQTVSMTLPMWRVPLATVERWRNGSVSTSFSRAEALAKLSTL